MDEMRYGLISNFRRSWSKRGERTVIDAQMEYKSLYLFSAISPETGESFHQNGFSSMNSQNVYIFLKELQKRFPDNHLVIVWDNAPFHKSKDFNKLEDVTFINLPPYSPELNPVERFFAEVRKETANRTFQSIEEQEELLNEYLYTIENNHKTIKSLTYFPWIRNIS